MSFPKITQVFRRTVSPTHFVTPRVQRLRSPRSDNTAYLKLYENERLKNKFKALEKEKQQLPWEPLPKKQSIETQGTATLFAGKKIPIGLGDFDEIVNRGYTFIDKTSLIAEFIECSSGVSLVVRPRRFGKTTNLTMLKEFFSIPIYPDNENYRHELFRNTQITKRSCLLRDHFCKYPVIFLSLKDCRGATWSNMQATLCKTFAELYQMYTYIYDSLDRYERSHFDLIRSGKLQYEFTKDALKDLTKYLKTYHRRKCIVLIDEYDHPLEIAYRYQYFSEARMFFSDLFGALFKDNDRNIEKALLVGVSCVAKSGYMSDLNNLDVFPMYADKYATQFGFTEDEISILLQNYDKSGRLNEVKEWYNGYRAGNGIYLYNPWSINKFIDTNTLKAHWVDTGGTKTVKNLLWNSTEVFKNNTSTLLKGHAIKIGIREDIDYDELIQKSNVDQVLWTLLYYMGYLTKDENDDLCIPNMEVSTEWQEWLTSCNSFELDSILSLLLQGKLSEFKKVFPTFIMNALSYHDVPDDLVESNYHLFMLGMFHQAYCRGYKITSNREAGEGRFDLKIEPTEKVNFKTGIYMEFKVLKRGKKEKSELQNSANEALKQIKNKRYFSDLPTFTEQCVICGIAFQGKNTYITGEMLDPIEWQNHFFV